MTKTGSAARASQASPTEQSAFVCPECGKSFSRAQALGAQRSQTHGIAGTSRAARVTAKRAGAKSGTARGRGTASKGSDRRPGRSGGTQFDRDKVLTAVFPNGVRPKASVIAALAPWLDDAERLSKMGR